MFKLYLTASGNKNKTIFPNTSTSHAETSHLSNNIPSSQNNILQHTVLNIFKQSIILIVMFSLYNIAVSAIVFLIYCNNGESALQLMLSKL